MVFHKSVGAWKKELHPQRREDLTQEQGIPQPRVQPFCGITKNTGGYPTGPCEGLKSEDENPTEQH